MFDRERITVAFQEADGGIVARLTAAAEAVGCSLFTARKAVAAAGLLVGAKRAAGQRRRFDPAALSEAFLAAKGQSRSARLRVVAGQFGCTVPTVERALKGSVGADRQSESPRGPDELGEDHRAKILYVGHPATLEARTLFPTTVRDVGDEWLLKSGKHHAKIGSLITKGPWKGFPIYVLTLEERATCPTSCRHWGSCFGNNMNFARRWRHGEALEWRLRREVVALELQHPKGFAVRLHVLGDFYSVGYVAMWRELLERVPALHVFGYTARHDTLGDEVAYQLALLVRDYWLRRDPPRFAVRFSNAPVLVRSTITLESPVQRPPDAVICPAQWTPSGKKAECCAACGLCWNTDRRIGFLQH